MTRLLIILALLGFDLNAQTNYNKSWCLGANYIYRVTFSPSPQITIYNNTNFLTFTGGNSNICDSYGNIILATDGMNIYDSTGNFIDKGDTLASSNFYNYYVGFNPASQASIFLPFENRIYYLITLDASDSMFNWWFAPPLPHIAPFDRLLYHKIDMNANGGAGKVIQRSKIIVEQDSMLKAMMIACRHANGKDWWLVKQMYEYSPGNLKSKNKIATFLVTKDSVYPPVITYFQDFLFSDYDQAGQAIFNQDGTKYAATCRGTNKVFLADFDRCTGIFSNPKTYNVPNYSCHNPNDSSWVDSFTHGLEFSPSTQFLYISKSYNILQLDITDNDSATAWYHVAGLDTAWNYFPKYSRLSIGYDNKVYLGYVGAIRNTMSHIDNPDVKGLGCNFCAACLLFPYAIVSTPPNMPNYDLGELQPCWPVGSNDVEMSDNKFVVFPNPADAYVTIEYKLEKNESARIFIYDLLGRERIISDLSFSSNRKMLDVSKLEIGIYTYKFVINNKESYIGKIVIE